MNKQPAIKKYSGRALSILIALLIHGALFFFVVFTIKTAAGAPAERSGMMRLVDIREAPLPRRSGPAAVPESGPAPVSFSGPAEQFIETEKPDPSGGGAAGTGEGTGDSIDYLPMSRLSQSPRFPEDELLRRTTYPPMARRAGLEGTVYLELFIDASGLIRSVSVLKEDPPDRGFGEAAVKAFRGLTADPALAEGRAVASRYRYRFRFTLK